MARRCDLTDKGPQSGHIVSHAENKTKRRFKVNVQHVRLTSEALDKHFRLKLAVNTLRSIEHNGGLDPFLLTASDRNLSAEGVKLKRKVKKALVAKGTLKKPEPKKRYASAASKKKPAAKKAAKA